MTEIQPPLDSRLDYQRLAQKLITHYAPPPQAACEITGKSATPSARDSLSSNRTRDEDTIQSKSDTGSDISVVSTSPVSYTRPAERDPFEGIDSTDQLPPAGELLCRIIRLVDWIIVSPHLELTHKRKLGKMIEQLHQQHNYALEAIQSDVVNAAQTRGDLPDTEE
jgi:hypothetical protein